MTRPAGTARKSQHGNRHDHGLVLPGKKLAKQKSNGHLNGTASSQHRPDPPSSLSPCDPSAQQHPQPMTTLVATANVNGVAEDPKRMPNGQVQVNGHGRNGVGLANGHVFPPTSTDGMVPAAGFEEQASRRSEKTIGSASSTKRACTSHSVNPFHLASTILKSCPMSDTIAILIFLLQLPPIVLTLVQFLYASMTFMLPAGVSTGTFTSVFDIFQGPAGTPSLSTMIAMDTFCLLVWGLFMWNWARNFAIDLAHVQVAIALGAGSSGDTGGVNAFCVTVVLIVHVLRSEGIQNFVVGHLLSANIFSTDTLERLIRLIPEEFKLKDAPSSPSWVRSLLAVHILAQATTAMARRSMAKNRAPTRSKSGKRPDTEASVGSQIHGDSSILESGTALASGTGQDSSSIPSAGPKDGREKGLSAKKRRRQANEARRIQPFWAALASTKLTVAREYERSRQGNWYAPTVPIAEDDLEGPSRGNGLVWITNVDSSSIKFAASDFSGVEDPVVGGMYDGSQPDGEAEPFYVCVNGAQWAPVTLDRIPENSNEPSLVHWRGEIVGLAPDCAYSCSFVRYDTNEQICVMSVRTPPTSDADQALATPSVAPSPRQSLRPSSPTTTIKNSIINAEAKLNERRSKLKRSKNDHKVQISKLRKELDNFTHRLKSGGDESRQKQRSLQLERTIRQTEEATAAIDLQLENLEKVPEDNLQEWKSCRAAFEEESVKAKSLKSSLEAAKISLKSRLSASEAELAQVIQKKERLNNRRNRLSEQYDRITNANVQGVNERERRSAEQLAKEQERAKVEEAFHEQLTSITRSLEEYQALTTQLWQQASAIEQSIQQQQLLMNTGPLTPEGELPGTKGNQMEPSMSTGPMSTMLPASRSNVGPPPFTSYASDMPSLGHRSSMSPIIVTTSLATTAEQQSSPLANKNSLFAPDQGIHRHRSMSNFSGRHIPGEFNNQSFASESAGLVSENPQPPVASPVLSNPAVAPFLRTSSRSSGSASGSGSGSAGASPHSTRGKPAWN